MTAKAVNLYDHQPSVPNRKERNVLESTGTMTRIPDQRLIEKGIGNDGENGGMMDISLVGPYIVLDSWSKSQAQSQDVPNLLRLVSSCNISQRRIWLTQSSQTSSFVPGANALLGFLSNHMAVFVFTLSWPCKVVT